MDATMQQQLSPNLPVIDKLFAAVLTERTEQNVHTARSPVSVQKGHSTLDPLLAFTALEKQRQRDGLRTHTFFLDMKGIRQGLACWPVLEAAQEWHHRQTVAHHP
jgi:hypothetical protein